MSTDNFIWCTTVALDHCYAIKSLKECNSCKTVGETDFDESYKSYSNFIKSGEVVWNGKCTNLEVGLSFSSRDDVRRFMTLYSESVGNKMVVTAGGATADCKSNSV